MFQITPLPKAKFDHLFALDDQELARHRAVRVTATKKPGFPCRVSLADAEPGEELILAHYEHHDVHGPFRASHAVYVRRGVQEAEPNVDEVPVQLRMRILSLRGFDEAGMLMEADLCDGLQLESGLAALFRHQFVAYVHIHFAKPGCYAARADRA